MIFFFFCPECLDCVNHKKIIILFKNKISVLEVELWLKIKKSNLWQQKFSASYKESVAAIVT